MPIKKQQLVVLEPKNEIARQKLGYNGTHWYLRDKVANRHYIRTRGASYVLRSRDGSRILFVQVEGDPLFNVRLL